LQSVYFARNNYQPQANLWLGKAYMQKHEDLKAAEALKKAAEQSLGQSPEAHLLLAEVYLRLKREKDAEQECYTAISETLGRAYKAYNMLGKVFMYEENWTGAQGQFQQALGDPPYTYTEAWINLVECMMRQQNWIGALQEMRAMLTNTKKLVGLDYERVYLDVGICLLAKGDHQGAIDNWHRTLDYNPSNAEAHLQLAMLYDAEKHVSSAIKEYKEYIRVSSDTKRVEQVKDRITIIEHMLSPTDVQPAATPPSPYMRKQSEERQVQAPPQSKDSGF
jgi:Tfp pilus assembly protein PilF